MPPVCLERFWYKPAFPAVCWNPAYLVHPPPDVPRLILVGRTRADPPVRFQPTSRSDFRKNHTGPATFMTPPHPSIGLCQVSPNKLPYPLSHIPLCLSTWKSRRERVIQPSFTPRISRTQGQCATLLDKILALRPQRVCHRRDPIA